MEFGITDKDVSITNSSFQISLRDALTLIENVRSANIALEVGNRNIIQECFQKNSRFPFSDILTVFSENSSSQFSK